MTPIQIDQAMQAAVGHHQSGRLAEADVLYRQVLTAKPNHPDALHFLGLLARRAGHFVDAANLIGRAIAIQPNQPEYHNNLGVTLMYAGQRDLAIMAFQRATRLRPDYAEAFTNLGAALKDQGLLEEAAAAFHQAIELRGDLAESHQNLGNVLRAEGKLPEAIAAYRRAIQLRPDLVESQTSLGNALAQHGLLTEATAVYRHALQLAPASANLLNNLGNVLIAQRMMDEGIAEYRLAIADDPRLVMSYSNLANALREIGEFDEAISHLRQAIELQPDFAAAYNNLGNTLKDQGRLEEAITAMRTSIELDPTSAAMRSNLVYAVCFHPDYDGQRHLREATAWAEQHERPLEAKRRPHLNDPSPERKLRIGYVSPDLRNHVVGRNVLPILERHDREQFEVHCFMTGGLTDELTPRFQNASSHWHDVASFSDQDLAEVIRKQQIDILVDLSLHMSGNRLLTFARKPSPVQVTWAGYPGTTGLRSIDYRITDPHLDPAGAGDEFYSEKSVRLPHSFWCYRAPEGAPEVNPSPATSAGFVTFGCLNNFSKVTPAAIDLWADVLLAVPGSQIGILTPHGSPEENLRRHFTAKKIQANRVQFIARTLPADYLKLYHAIDICLDPIPYTGHTTSLDALWMGVPIVTLKGNSAVARGGVTPLTNLQLEMLIASTPEQFVQAAAELAGNLKSLATLRRTLRNRMAASPLCDEVQFTADLEVAYRLMWREWCRSAKAST